MTKKLITVDIDDVIASSTEAFRLVVNQHTGANLTSEDYRVPHTGYNDYYEHVWRSHGLNVIYDEFSLPMRVDQSHIALVDGAKNALTKLSKQYDIAFITSRSISWQDATHVYINTKLKGLKADIHFTEQEGTSKGQVCQELGAEWHIDDNPDHCKAVLAAGIKAILFGDYGWHHKAPKNIHRCKDWAAVLEYFDGRG